MGEFWTVNGHFGQWRLLWSARSQEEYKILDTKDKLSKQGSKDKKKNLRERRGRQRSGGQ